jgi:hypothetical protein
MRAFDLMKAIASLRRPTCHRMPFPTGTELRSWVWPLLKISWEKKFGANRG